MCILFIKNNVDIYTQHNRLNNERLVGSVGVINLRARLMSYKSAAY